MDISDKRKPVEDIAKFIEEFQQANNILDELAQHRYETELSLPERVEQLEVDAIRSALFDFDNNRTRAARSLGISREVLSYKIKKYQKKL